MLIKLSSAQVDAVLSIQNVQCMHFKLGKATVTITSAVNPPYSFQWSNGQNSSGNSASIENLEVQNYFVIISDASGYDTTITFTIQEIECEMAPEIGFTPNGDGYNDTWYISNSQYFPNALVLVYNRWGQKVYENKGLYEEPWDGRDMFGTPLPDASYFFLVYKDKKDEKAIKKGSVSIVR